MPENAKNITIISAFNFDNPDNPISHEAIREVSDGEKKKIEEAVCFAFVNDIVQF